MIHLYCGGHDEPVEMSVEPASKGLFYYRCHEPGCGNEISIHDTEKLIDAMSERIEDGMVTQNIKGFSYKIRGHKCFVSKHKPGRIDIVIGAAGRR